MKTHYIHGLGSSLLPGKMTILKQYGLEPVGLNLDYKTEPEPYNKLKQFARDNSVKFIIGSSMGGYFGFWLANELKLPCLLFNPAIADTAHDSTSPDYNSPARMAVIGDKDTVINPEISFNFLKSCEKYADFQKIIFCSWLAHQIDFDTFDEMTAWSVKNLKRLGYYH